MTASTVHCSEMFADVIERTLNASKPRDCYEIYIFGRHDSDGVYTVYVGCEQRPVKVYCDMTTDGGGWTVCIMIHKLTVDELLIIKCDINCNFQLTFVAHKLH